MLSNHPWMYLKLILKKQLKTAEETGDLIGIKITNKTLRRQLKVKQKYQKKDI